MKKRLFFWGTKFGRRQEGAVAVEFALVIMLLLFIVGGVIDFGHYIYLKHVATNASREGARYGSLYSSSSRASETDIRTYIQQKYGSSLGYSDSSGPSVTVVGAGGASGTDLTVTVTADKHWFLLNAFMSSLPETAKGVTVMKLE